MNRYFLFILMGCLSLQFVSAQAVSETFRFNKDSLSKNFIIDVPQDRSTIDFEINGRLTSGSIDIEIYNSNGVLLENFKLDAVVKKSKQELKAISKIEKRDIGTENVTNAGGDNIITGEVSTIDKVVVGFAKTYYNPSHGHWVVKMLSQKAEAKIKVKLTIK